MYCPNLALNCIYQQDREAVCRPNPSQDPGICRNERIAIANPYSRTGGYAVRHHQYAIGMDLFGRHKPREVRPAAAQPGSESMLEPRELGQRLRAIYVLGV